MCKFSNIQEVFDLLNANHTPYLILRNYDNLLNNDIYMDGHGDIDILCAESKSIVKALNAKTNHIDRNNYIGDGTHYYIFVQDKVVSLDLRFVGDGYYCEKWQHEMLNSRILHNGFFVMDSINHFYSLIYHAILQKKTLSSEYLSRLLQMAKNLNINLSSSDEKGLLTVLEVYMKEKGFTYTYCYDHFIPLQFHKVDKRMITPDKKRYWKHLRFRLKVEAIEFLVKIKHFIS